MKIYVVTKGSYSDYRIIAATLNEEKARGIADKFSTHYEKAGVEIYDDGDVENMLTKKAYLIRFNMQTGDVVRLEDRSNDEYDYMHVFDHGVDYSNNFYIKVVADTPEEAIKIGAEKRAEFLANQEGIV